MRQAEAASPRAKFHRSSGPNRFFSKDEHSSPPRLFKYFLLGHNDLFFQKKNRPFFHFSFFFFKKKPFLQFIGLHFAYFAARKNLARRLCADKYFRVCVSYFFCFSVNNKILSLSLKKEKDRNKKGGIDRLYNGIVWVFCSARSNRSTESTSLPSQPEHAGPGGSGPKATPAQGHFAWGFRVSVG